MTAILVAGLPVGVGLALGERPSALAGVGVVLALVAVVLVSREASDEDVRPHRFTDQCHHLYDVMGAHHARVYLVGAKTPGYHFTSFFGIPFRRLMPRWICTVNFGLVPLSAQELIDGKPGGFSGYIPKGDVYRGPCLIGDAPSGAQDWQAIP